MSLRLRAPLCRLMARRLLHTTVAARKDPNLQDPYPLPLQSAAGLERDRSPESFTPHPMDGLGDKDIDIDNMRARLVYQTRKRGTLETGLLLSTFATSDRLSKMGADELLELDELLTIPEWTLFYWATGKEELPKDSPWRESKILALLKEHCANKGKEIRSMPELDDEATVVLKA